MNASSQDRGTFNSYNRSSQHIVIHDNRDLAAVDSVPVREVLEINQSTPKEYQKIPNEEVFRLMEEEDLMRENRIPE